VESTRSHTFTRSELNIRPALPEDRAALETIASQIWEGADYLPRVLDEWFNDLFGGFYVATYREQVIGVAKLTRFGENEWWMEGLRVDPAYQGFGISRILHHFVLNQLRQMGQGVVRFSTASDNVPVHKLAQETGFERAAAYSLYIADPLDEPVQGLRLLGPDDLPRIRAWLENSPHYFQTQRSFEWDWSFYFLTDERLSERLAAGLVYGWQDLHGLLIINPLGEDRWPEITVLKVAYLDAGNNDLAALALDVRRLAMTLNRSEMVRIKSLDQPERSAALEQAGYHLDWDEQTWLYTRDISLTLNAEVHTEDLLPTNQGP